jgi:hypothetical protein
VVVAGAARLLFGDAILTHALEVFETGAQSSFLFGLFCSALLLSLAAFWCASSLKDTIHAAIWVFPVVAAAAWVYRIGLAAVWLRDTPLLQSVLSRLHPFPITNATESVIFRLAPARVAIVLLAVSVLPLVLIQSYRCFRTEAHDGVPSTVRHLLVGLVVIFLCSFVQQLPFAVMYGISTQTWSVLGEVSKAVAESRPDLTGYDAAHPLELSEDDLLKASPLSSVARRWLTNAKITVTPRTFTRPGVNRGRLFSETFSYFTTVHIRNNWACSVYGTQRIVFSCTSPSGTWGYPVFP